jgi:hypothetical protein
MFSIILLQHFRMKGKGWGTSPSTYWCLASDKAANLTHSA